MAMELCWENRKRVGLFHWIKIVSSGNWQEFIAISNIMKSGTSPKSYGFSHYNDVIMSAMAPQITGVSIVCSNICSGADQGKHHSSASLAFVRGIHRWPAQRVSNAENGSIWWRHHVKLPASRLCVIQVSIKKTTRWPVGFLHRG